MRNLRFEYVSCEDIIEFFGEKKIQNLTDKFCKEADDLAAAKEKEIMKV